MAERKAFYKNWQNNLVIENGPSVMALDEEGIKVLLRTIKSEFPLIFGDIQREEQHPSKADETINQVIKELEKKGPFTVEQLVAAMKEHINEV